MSTFDGNNFYFSGQGVVMIGDRNSATGKPKGLIPVGNVSDLKLGLAATVLEHKESQSGNRSIDLRLTTELKSTLQMTIENFQSPALSAALSGSWAERPGSNLTAQANSMYFGKISAMDHIKVTNVVVKMGATSLVLYVDDATPYDYLLNPAAGSIKFNDGTVTPFASLTTTPAVPLTAPTGVTVGSTTTLTWTTVPPAIVTAGVGTKIGMTGFAGADASLLNGRAFTIVTITATTITLNKNTTGKVITIGVPKLVLDGEAIAIDYTYDTQNRVEALTTTTAEKYMRFEGLNTADGGLPVVVEVPRFITDPLKELALISDALGPFVLDGNVLFDPLILTGSKFFRITHLR